MDSPHDTPLKRFSAFWIGLLILALFAIIGLVFAIFDKNGTSDMEKAAAEGRLEIHERVNKEQAAELDPAAMKKSHDAMLQIMLTSKPSKGSMPVAVAPAAEGDAAATPKEAENKDAAPAAEGENKDAAPAKDAEPDKAGDRDGHATDIEKTSTES